MSSVLMRYSAMCRTRPVMVNTEAARWVGRRMLAEEDEEDETMSEFS
jgi:hypothetical protein